MSVPCRRLARSTSLALGVAALASFALASQRAEARPEGPRVFCQTYPDVAECTGQVVTCGTCHVSTDPATWNSYGLDLLAEIAPLTSDGQSFEEALPEALRIIEDLDSDDDGVDNLGEIRLGTLPGDPRSVWLPEDDPDAPDYEPNPWYAVGEYDYVFALRRAMILYCGESPSYELVQEMHELDGDPDMQHRRLHEVVSSCLAGDWWQRVGVRELADPKVKPISAVGPETELMISGFRVVLADYEWDYRLYSWIMTGDRDVRDLLLADYHVVENDQGQFEIVEGPIPDPVHLGQFAGGQPLAVDRRAGMLTSQWFLMSNTMFSALPRTTAAQAYRAYLGMDISLNEGIWPVAGEPTDVDDMNVAQAACAACHSTLDPLAYAFAYYTGIEVPGTGLYAPGRPAATMPAWDPQLHRSVLFGEPVDDVMGWAAVAAESDAFKHKLATDLFGHALGRGPNPDEREAFTEMWRALPGDGWSANAMIHRLVDTQAFGVP